MIFLNGLMLALPLITLLLTLNLALGLLNRMARNYPFCYWISINSDCRHLFNGGINAVNCAFCEHLFSEIFNFLADIISELPLI